MNFSSDDIDSDDVDDGCGRDDDDDARSQSVAMGCDRDPFSTTLTNASVV